jgi:hypothetical protein
MAFLRGLSTLIDAPNPRRDKGLSWFTAKAGWHVGHKYYKSFKWLCVNIMAVMTDGRIPRRRNA